MNIITCKNCKKEFKSFVSNKRKFCEKKCYHRFKQNNPDLFPNTFYKGHKFYKGGEKGWFKKGNISPNIKYRIFIDCNFCHKRFQTTKFKVKKGKKFCSRKCWSESRKGIGNNMWKGGIIIHNGYWVKRIIGHPRAKQHSPYVKLAILNMEKKIGRYLKSNEIVHHINQIKTDDRIKNLMLLTSVSEHQKLHRRIS